MHDRQLRLTEPLVMAIVNVTPDSFSDTEHRMDAESVARAAVQAVSEGADIIDIGGCSTRPGSTPVSEEEELRRVELGVRAVRAVCPEVIISVDTFRSRVAEKAVEAWGADIINDVSAGLIDPRIVEVAGRLGVPYILTHTRPVVSTPSGAPMAGLSPESANQSAPAESDIVASVSAFFSERIEALRRAGVRDIILDPGYGFGKALEENYALLCRQRELLAFGLPLLAGISHKSMIFRPLGVSPSDTLIGTSALHMVALQGGAAILRVHEVREAKQVITLHSLCQASE